MIARLAQKLESYKTRYRRYFTFQVLFVFICVMTIVNFGINIMNSVMAIRSKSDSAQLHEAQSEIEANQLLINKLQTDAAEREKVNQILLAARTENQYATTMAVGRAGLYNEEEKRAIGENWKFMDYGKFNPFREYQK